MEVVCLLRENEVRSAIWLALPRFRWGSTICQLMFGESWEELERIAGPEFDGVFVVDPSFGGHEKGPPQQLARVKSSLGEGGLILYSRFAGQRGRRLIPTRVGAGGSLILLDRGGDDHPNSILRAIAAAASSRRFSGLLDRLGRTLAPEGASLLRALFNHWPRSRSTDELAQRVNSSSRNLRRLTEIHALPSPSRILRAVRLMDGFSLRELGVTSRSRLACLLGYCDAFSLSRSFRAFAGGELDDLLLPGEWDRTAQVLASSLWVT